MGHQVFVTVCKYTALNSMDLQLLAEKDQVFSRLAKHDVGVVCYRVTV